VNGVIVSRVLLAPPSAADTLDQTDDSLQNLNGQIQAGGILGELFNFVIQLIGGKNQFKQTCKEAGETAVKNKHATCPYPLNSTPVCKGTNTLPGTTCNFSKLLHVMSEPRSPLS
jgi:hypothetical protein